MKRKQFTALFSALLLATTLMGGCGNTEKPKDMANTTTTAASTTTTANGVGETVAVGTTTTAAELTTTTTESAKATTKVTAKPTTSRTKAPATTVVKTADAAVVPTAPAVSKPAEEKPVVVTLTPLSKEKYYGITHLRGLAGGAALVTAYHRLAAGVEAMDAQISFKDEQNPLTSEQLMQVMACYHADYPQHFWFNGAITLYTSGETVLYIEPTYTLTPAAKATAQAKFQAAVSRLVSEAAKGRTAYERELILHDQLVNATVYTTNAPNAHNAYGALVEGKAVCEGYARAFQYLLYQAGIPCLFVEGSSVRPGNTASESHAWNMVQIDGAYYHVDATWDDPVGDKATVMHAFFNVNDTRIAEDHAVSKTLAYPLPACNATTANYHIKNGTVLNTFAVDRVAALLKANGQGVALYIENGTPESFYQWFSDNLTAIAQKAGIVGNKGYDFRWCGREVVVTVK